MTQLALLNATNNELNSKTNEDVNNTLRAIEENLAELTTMIENGVDKLIQMEVDCFTRINLTVCGEIIDGHTAFRSLLQEIAEHFEKAEYLESILIGRNRSIEVIRQKLTTVTRELRIIENQITAADKKETEEAIDSSTSSNTDVMSCPALGQVRFIFDSRSINTNQNCQRGENSPAEDSCIDFEVPANATSKDLWNVHSCAVDSELKSLGLYNNFTKLMNSAPVKITASLLRVNVHRPWFDASIFEDTEHYKMASSYVTWQ